IAFSGLRRALNAHPESLSRSLRRLEREGRVERVQDGYRATNSALPSGRWPAPTIHSVGEVTLPSGVVPESVLGRLAGRWFGSLRWVGVMDGPEGQLLAWARRDGTGPILLGVRRGALHVYLRSDGPAGVDPEAEDSAYELLVHALEALRPSVTDVGRRVTLFSAESPYEVPLEN
ncbi:MAG TPA: hypothetical protein VEG42_04870, partial [Thermoplasmata archaeon]|nr:hypothetical protein [Thermoplasmata archaeon]